MIHAKDIILAFLLVGSTVCLEVEITPTQGEISVGESKFFLCEVVGVAKEIDWYSPSGERIEPNKPEITVTRNDESSSTLTLYKAGVDSAGTYKCLATNGDQSAEATVNVKFYQRITFKNAPSPQEFNEGDNAKIVCDVISSPPPTIIWKHKGAKIQMEKDVRFKILPNNHLQIRGIKKTDEGSYTCEGRLMARGEIDLKIIRVIVNVLPTIRVWQSEVNATAGVGQSAMLTCAADGYPEPMVTWARAGVLLESGDKYSFNEDGSEMTIMEVAKLDEGEYTCIAKNKAGESEQELSLRVFVKPKITFLLNQSTSEMEEQVTLTCEASGDPTPTINWSFGLRTFTEGEQSLDGNVVVRSDARVSSLTLKYAKFTDAGQYLCSARNAIGVDSQPAYLEVRYAPKIQGSVTVYTWEGNAANISCEVLAHPSDVSMLWLRDGFQLPNANVTKAKVFQSPTASYLEVTPESENDFGSYNCTASNEMGTESKEFLLIQADVPSAPSLGEVEPFSSSARVEFQEPDATGGVPVLRYRAEWKTVGRGSWVQKVYEVQGGTLSEVTIIGLKPETNYEVKMLAINGKGEGETSPALVFKTEPVRYSYAKGEPEPPKLEGTLQTKGNSLKVNWIKQDDGGSPITHYLVRYKPKHQTDWKPEIRLPSGSEYVVLSGLEWNTEYDVFVVAENQQGKSQPGTLTFRTSPEPAAIPDIDGESALSTGIMAGILILAFVLLLLAVDITCYFTNKCGLIMCLCGKPGSGAKGHNLEQGKAAFIKDESKEPIVEVRTEDECTANHNAGGPTEPNETTPLTEPELAALALDTLSSVATISDTANTIYDPAQDSPSSESTALTCSLSAPSTDPLSTPVTDPLPAAAPAPAPTSESNTAPPTPLISTSDITATPLLDLLEDSSPRAEDKMSATAVSATDCPKSLKKSPIPIPPRRRNSNRPAPSPPTPKSPTPTHFTTVASRKSAPDSPSLSPSTASPIQNTRKAAPSPAPMAFTFPASDTSTDKPAPTATSTVTPVPGTPTVLGSSTPAPDPDKPDSTTKDTHTPAPNIDPTTTPTSVPNIDPTTTPTSVPNIDPTTTPTSVPNINRTTTPTSVPNIDPTTTPTSVPSAPTTAFNADVTAAIVHEDTTKSALVFPDILTPTPAPTSAPTPAPNAPTAPSFATPAAPTVTITPTSTTYDTPTPTLTPHIPITTEPQAPEIEFELTNGVVTKSPSLPPAGSTGFQSSPTPSPAPVPSSSSFQANGDGFGADLQASGPPALEELDSLAKAAPLNNEKIFGDEKSKVEEVKTAQSEVTTEHNDVTQTSDSKA
ncbi:neural cell adhesion molecule 1b isoform X4 [Oncorhynchus mykiss]|uniref:neural cell adhesion molecule 1b isoform X4 n=1 Tax=Oncorhynchus mykiss TaxID=8022 RepID=UPI001878FB7A|nr:neural cell adhesion molecule 1b isoform X4 [Oncorhynchus mykiss]